MRRDNNIIEYVSGEKKIFSLHWEEIFNLEKISKDYVAQGIVRYKEYIIFSIHAKDKKSVILFFKDKKNGEFELVNEVIMPLEATHTSDMAVFNNKLYAIDFHSNFVYEFKIIERDEILDLELVKKAKINFKDKNFGSFSIIEKGEKVYLLATSFNNDNRIWVFDFNDLFVRQLGFEDSIIFETEGSYFTQGLFHQKNKGKLFISVNRFGKDFIYRLDVDTFLLTKDANKSIEVVYLAPGRMVEDVYVDDEYIYTSDEETNKIYRAKIDNQMEVNLEKLFNLRDYKYYNKLLSHRNRVQDFQENTLDGVISVLKTGVKYIEVDVRLSADNMFFTYHDPYFIDGFKRFRFYNKTLHEIRRERYRENKTRISLFEDILKYFSKHRNNDQMLMVDIKDSGEENRLIDLIEKYEMINYVEFYTWTPQVILDLDKIFDKRGISRPIHFSHIRTDSIFRYIFVPQFLNWKKHFLTIFDDFVLIGNKNYKTPLGKYARGYRHSPYFFTLPVEITDILKKHKGGIGVSAKSRRFPLFAVRYFKKYKKMGLKTSVFGPFFGEVKIDTKKWFENLAEREEGDIVFMDDLDKML